MYSWISGANNGRFDMNHKNSGASCKELKTGRVLKNNLVSLHNMS